MSTANEEIRRRLPEACRAMEQHLLTAIKLTEFPQAQARETFYGLLRLVPIFEGAFTALLNNDSAALAAKLKEAGKEAEKPAA